MTAVGQPGAAKLRTPAPEGGEVAGAGSAFRLGLRVFLQHRLAVIGLGIIVFMVLFSYIGPLIYHTDQVHTHLTQVNLPPSARHVLGTDEVGYDELGRLMVAGQSSLEVGLAASILASIMGTVYGAISGFLGGWVDGIMMRILDSLLAFPALLLLLLIVSIVPPSIPVMIGVIALVAWLVPARLVRGETLSVRVRDYVQAAKVLGSPAWRTIGRHIVPNVIGVIVVQTTLEVANAILLLAALGYLGLGLPPPATNWGQMLSDGLNFIYDGYWWLVYPPGVAIVLTVLAFNFLGDALRDSLDVRLQQR
jgi:peptide/nickel transport system permease protein